MSESNVKYLFKNDTNWVGVTFSEKVENPFMSVNIAVTFLSSPPSFN